MSLLFQKKTSSAIPLPRQEFIIAGTILGLVLIAWLLYSVLHPRIDSTDRTLIGTLVLKEMEPLLYSRDYLFAREEIFGYYTPVYRWVMRAAWRLGGTFETGFIGLLLPIMSFYLIGMFILLYRITGNNWIALGLTIASAHYHNIMGADGWGVGSSASLGARTLFMPAVPMIALALLKALEEPGWAKGALLGILLGLAANLHPVSGFHLLAILVALLIVIHGKSYRGWHTVMATIVTAIIGACPTLWNYLAHAGGRPDATFEVFRQIIQERYPMPFYPATFQWPLVNIELTRPTLDVMVWLYLGLAVLLAALYLVNWPRRITLLRWAWLVGGLLTVFYGQLLTLFEGTFIFTVVGLYIIYRFWRWQYSPLEAWFITLMGLVVLYSFVGYYLFTYIWQRYELWALTSFLTEYARSARFIYLPVYALAGLAGTAWAKELAPGLSKITGRRVSFGSETDFAIMVAVFFALVTSVTAPFSTNLPLTLLAVGLLLLFTFVVVFVIKQGIPIFWRSYLALFLIMLLLFGPLAPLLGDYLPVPTTNLLQANSLTAEPIYDPVDAELYRWVWQNSSRDSLFYGCFGPVTMTHFRFRGQRSISHSYKDLTILYHNRATLVAMYDRFRKFEAACSNLQDTITAARSIQADYILASSNAAASFLAEACFANEKYAVFALKPGVCAR